MEPLTSILVLISLAQGASAEELPGCVAGGRVYEQGEVACLDIPCAPQLARCGMRLNNSAWIKIQDGCVVSGGDVPAGKASGSGGWSG